MTECTVSLYHWTAHWRCLTNQDQVLLHSVFPHRMSSQNVSNFTECLCLLRFVCSTFQNLVQTWPLTPANFRIDSHDVNRFTGGVVVGGKMQIQLWAQLSCTPTCSYCITSIEEEPLHMYNLQKSIGKDSCNPGIKHLTNQEDNEVK